MGSSIKICFAASEATPYAKTGGLADVAAALPSELRRREHDVRLFIPLHSRIVRTDYDLKAVESAQSVELELGPHRFSFSLFTAKAPGGLLDVYFVDCPALYDRPGIYTGEIDEALRFAFFSRAIIESCQRLGWAPDIFHSNDWHTALIPFLLKTVYEWDSMFHGSRSLVTIHNLGYQGTFPSASIGEIGLDNWSHKLDQDDLQMDRVNFLRTGLIYTDAISTVSPTYAREIQSDEHGMGLEQLLRARRDSLVGILNGVDYGEWDPADDRFLPHHYGPDSLEGKRLNKQHLLQTLGLDPDLEAPLLGIISRLAHQKGFDLCFEVLPEALHATSLRLVVLGSGEERYEEFFAGLQQQFPGRVCYHEGYHDELAHMIEAASDMFLMPSRYEPCGLNQLFSMKYGTLPIVRATGGLADSVTAVDSANGEGTGFLFEHFTAAGMRWAMTRALEAWGNRPLWDGLMQNAMRRDFSWGKQARPYLELYNKLLNGA